MKLAKDEYCRILKDVVHDKEAYDCILAMTAGLLQAEKEAKRKLWVVTAVRTGADSDGKAKALYAAEAKEGAKRYVELDMKRFAEEAGSISMELDTLNMSAKSSDGNYGCEWNVEEVEIQKSA